MKRFFIAVLLLILVGNVSAQQKITWSYSAKSLGNNKYELRLTATPPLGWHIYSTLTPEGGPIPTTFKFNNNALLSLQGKVKEKGKVDVKYFEGKADFVQIVTVKGKIKTNISGEIESMICNDRTCMPPTTEKFNIALN